MHFGDWDVFETEEEFERFTELWFTECVRVLKEDGWMYIFFSWRNMDILYMLKRKFNLVVRTNFTWIKTNPPPSYRKFGWRSGTEGVIVFTKTKDVRIPNFLDQDEMVNYKKTSCRCNYGISGHPTEKPINLMELFVRTSSNEGDVVLDPFMGCYDKETEILTKDRGWILFKDLTIDDEVACLSKDHILYWHKPSAIQKYTYEGEMIKINHRSVDLLVTPNHKLYLKELRKKYEFMKAKNPKYENLKSINSINWKGLYKEFFLIELIKLDA